MNRLTLLVALLALRAGADICPWDDLDYDLQERIQEGFRELDRTLSALEARVLRPPVRDRNRLMMREKREALAQKLGISPQELKPPGAGEPDLSPYFLWKKPVPEKLWEETEADLVWPYLEKIRPTAKGKALLQQAGAIVDQRVRELFGDILLLAPEDRAALTDRVALRLLSQRPLSEPWLTSHLDRDLAARLPLPGSIPDKQAVPAAVKSWAITQMEEICRRNKVPFQRQALDQTPESSFDWFARDYRLRERLSPAERDRLRRDLAKFALDHQPESVRNDYKERALKWLRERMTTLHHNGPQPATALTPRPVTEAILNQLSRVAAAHLFAGQDLNDPEITAPLDTSLQTLLIGQYYGYSQQEAH